jgi:hypothetical protein
MSTNHGNLMAYNGDRFEVEENQDPYQGYKVVPRMALDDCPDVRRF